MIKRWSSVLMTGIAVVSLAWGGGKNAPACIDRSNGCYPQKVYVDKKTGLMWQDEAYTPKEDGAYARGGKFGKAGSQKYAAFYCDNLTYAGYNDWRLPTADELETIHYYRGQMFTYYRGADFWTATPTTNGKYYVVYAPDAMRYKRSPRKTYYIRCVRCADVK